MCRRVTDTMEDKHWTYIDGLLFISHCTREFWRILWLGVPKYICNLLNTRTVHVSCVSFFPLGKSFLWVKKRVFYMSTNSITAHSVKVKQKQRHAIYTWISCITFLVCVEWLIPLIQARIHLLFKYVEIYVWKIWAIVLNVVFKNTLV